MTPLGREPCPHSTGTSWGCVAAPAPCSYPCSYPRCRCATWHRHLACSSDAGGRFGQSSSRIRARGKNGLRVRLASRGGWEHVGHPQLATADVAPRAGPHFWSPLPKNGAAAAQWGCSWAAPGSGEHFGRAGTHREARGEGEREEMVQHGTSPCPVPAERGNPPGGAEARHRPGRESGRGCGWLGRRTDGRTDGWTDGRLPPRAPLAQPGRGRVKVTAVTPAGFFSTFSAEPAGGHVLLRFRCFGGFCPAGYDPCRQQAAVPSRCHHPTAARWPQGIPGWFWGAPGGCSAPSPAGSRVAWCWQSPRFQLARGRAEPDLVSCDGEVVN